MAAAGWGSNFYATNTDTIMRKQFADIRYIFETTDNAVEMLRRENITIDLLHIDADHSYEQSLADFTNYFDLLAPRAVVSFHDTCRDVARKCKTGVAQMLDIVRQQSDKYGLQLLDTHYLYRGIALAIRQEAPALEAPANSCGIYLNRSDEYDEKFPQVRRLPISHTHLLNDRGRHVDVLPRSTLDTLVCLQCENHLMNDAEDGEALRHLSSLVRSLPRLRTIILDVPHSNGESKDTWLDGLMENDGKANARFLGWQVKSDVLLDSQRMRKIHPDARTRRMVRLVKY